GASRVRVGTSTNLSSARGDQAPALHRPALDRLEYQPVSEKPQDSDCDNSHENRIGLVKVARIVDKKSKTSAGGDHLSGDKGAPGEADAHTNPGHDIRHRARNQYLKDDVAPRAAQSAHRMLEDPRDAPHPHQRVVEDQKEDRVEHDKGDAHPAKPEP